MTFDLRLMVYSPFGGRLGVLPHPLSVEVGMPMNDVPSLKVAYTTTAVGADLLDQPCEIAVQWSTDGTTWTEAPDSRFLRIKRRGDSSDPTGLTRFELPGFVWMLRKIVLYPGSAPLVDGKRAFLSATAGAILQTFIAEAKGRGAVPGLNWDFTPTHDSAGAVWDKALTIYYQPGMDALTALQNLAEQGVCDYRVSGRTVQVFNADTTMQRDLASGAAPVDLRYGRDIAQAPDDGTLEDTASSVLVVGDNGLVKTLTNPAAVQPWGPWEQYIGAGGVSDEGTATILADSALERAGSERVQRTRGIVLYGARWLPLKDYRPGDRVLAPGDGGVLEPLRVRQVTLARNGAGAVGGSLVLNDRFLERDIRLARRTAGIVGGSTADGGSGARPVPAPEAPEPRTPAAPQGLIVNPIAYLDEHGFARGQVTVTWGAVTQDVGGVALNVGGYELFMRVNQTGAPWFLVASTEAGDTTATYSPLVVGESYAFKVRAVNLGKTGPFSSVVAVTIPDDADPPPVPTVPQLATRLGVIHVTWDGHGTGSVPMPSDFARLLVWMQNPLAPGWSVIDSMVAAGTIVVPGQPYGASRQFRFTSIDRSGNESAPSSSATIATSALVDTDIIGEVIDGAHLVDGSISASDKVVANSITGALIKALEIQTGHLAANAVTADKIKAGEIQAGHIGANQVTAAKLESVLTLSTRVVAGNASGARVELNSSGLVVFNASGQQTASISAATGAVSIVGQFASGVTGARVVVNPAGATNPEIRFIPGSGTNQSRIYSDGSRFTGEATLIMESGTNQASTAMCRLTHAAGFWQAAILNPSNGEQRGGAVSAVEQQASIGWMHPTQQDQYMLFDQSGTLHRGTWQYGSESGLIMMSVTLSKGATYYQVVLGYTFPTTPKVVFTAEQVSTMQLFSRTNSDLFFYDPAAGSPAPNRTFHIWAWR
ncbi:fibronectin type III domain-containing protein [Nonomuraea sediminis]|uniref:fibronectin type III domain-containing protein n=1 Tax=Nonomuraea sediminis TaxID=2835864 RepID=UPI001BDC6BC8|nr:fibronectin type III domain-containing protein [Nonomuraea sediminis]